MVLCVCVCVCVCACYGTYASKVFIMHVHMYIRNPAIAATSLINHKPQGLMLLLSTCKQFTLPCDKWPIL